MTFRSPIRFFVAILVLVIIPAVLAGCGATKKDAGSGVSAGKETKQTVEEPLVIRIGFPAGLKDSSMGKSALIFEEELKKRFGNGVKVELYPDGQLGKAQENLEQIQTGSLSMTIVGSEIGLLDERLAITEMPWLFDDLGHVNRAAQGEFGKQLASIIDERQIKTLGVWWLGYRHFATNKGHIRQPGDMKGIKLRYAPNPARNKMWQILQVQSVSLAAGEVYQALSAGMFDGTEATSMGIITMKWYEVLKYVTFNRYIASFAYLLASPQWLNKLPQQTQEKIITAADAATKRVWENVDDWEAEFEDFLRKNLDTYELTLTEINAFREILAPVREDYLKKYGEQSFKLVDKAR